MNTIITHLKELGLNEKQARIYLALVEIGKGTAYAIAKQAKVKRPTTYVILEELRLKGLVLKVPQNKNQVFIAKDPRELFAEQEEKLSYARRVLPELLARASKDSNTATTFLFEGPDGMKRALDYGLDQLEGKQLLCYHAKAPKGIHSVPKIYFDHYTNLQKRAVIVRGIESSHVGTSLFREMDKKFGIKTLSLPQSEFSSNISVEIAGTFIRVLLHKNSQALIIENKDFAEMMKQVFEIVWKKKV